MKKTLFALSAAALVLVPAAVQAQGFAVAGRAGTLGLGAEAALGLGPKLAIRGGVGLMPLEVDASDLFDSNGVEATLKLPKTWYNVGMDLYLGGGFRVGGGMMFKPDDPTVTGTLTGSASIEIGGVTYTASDVAEVEGALVSKSSAPYVLIGFGRHIKSGIGLFLDLGVAFMGDPDVQLTATGNPTVVNSSEFQSRLRTEEQNVKDDVGTYLNYWPILNLGLKFGIGG